MTVLVAFASKHGSTDEIARFIADRLSERGVEAKAALGQDVSDLSGIQAVVLGSFIHVGSWMKEALEFGERMMVKAVKAPEGDFRNWDEIGAWADGIATELMTSGG